MADYYYYYTTHKVELIKWMWGWLLLPILLILLVEAEAVSNEGSTGGTESFQRKGIFKTIESDVGGDVIDCVDIYQQPAFDHPLLQNHQLQKKPKWYPDGWKPKKKQTRVIHRQPWLEKDECPHGTVPILRRRRKPDDVENHNIVLKNRGDLYPLPRKLDYPHRIISKVISGSQETAAVTLVRNPPETYHGLCAEFDIWNPITRPTEYSSTRIIAKSSATVNQTGRFDALEAGWIVYPGRYYGSQTRLYTLWTNDSFKNYCYDLDCPGFIQVEKKYAIGCVLWATSKYGGEQQTLEIKIWREPQKGNWWLRVDDTLLGYWPAELFPQLSKGAQNLEWGGEVLNTKEGGGNKHTTTQMGSGVMPYQGFKYAAYMSRIYYVNDTHVPVEPDNRLQMMITKPMCYGLTLHPKDDSPSRGVYFFYGGPGLSDECL